MTLNRLLDESARRFADRPALLFTDGQSLTYRELDERARRLAHELRRRADLEPGSLVAIYTHRSLETVVAMLAVWKAGAAFVPVDPLYPQERVAYILEQGAVPLVLAHESLSGWLDRSRHAVLTLDHDLAPVLRAEGPEPTGELPEVDPEQLAYVIFTSGSTGKPKGCMLPHRAAVAFIQSMIAFPGLSPSDRVLTNAPLIFDMMVYEIFFPLAVGALAVMTARDIAADGAKLVDALERFDITAMMATPATWRLLIAAGWKGRPGFHLVSAGEALTQDLARELLTRSDSVYNMYGPTETAVIATVETVTDVEQITIGRPTAGTRMLVVDPAGRPLPMGEAGELYIGGPQVGLGYLARPDLTKERFVPNVFTDDAASPVFYRTGDLCRLRPDGRIDYLGRIDGQVKIRGFRIELGEIEAKLGAWPEIRWAVVIAREDVPGDKRLVAYVLLRDGVERLDVSALRRALAKELPDYMIPPHVVTMEAFPLTTSGKVDRQLLPPPLTRRASLSEPCIAPRSGLERELVEVFAGLLQYDTLSVDDPLFELGLNSLLVVRATAALAQRGIALTAAEIFQRPTIEALAQRLEQDALAAAASSSIAGAANGGRDIAVVGMAGRFPGARDIVEFWSNLRAGLETTTWFSADEISSRVSDAELADPAYVRARGLIGDVSQFDAAFFGINPTEAAMLDPQQRIFLEEAWHALEDAGHVPERFAGRIGVFAGGNRNLYFLEMLRTNPGAIEAYGDFAAMIAAEKDFLSMRVAHRLDLDGPAVSVQTACSTSLVAVIEAVAALREGRCDMALAGGVSIVVPQKSGHRYEEGSIMTRDGHCRPFAAEATGTLWADGVGVVALRRLEDALRDQDHVYAVIKGVGINNDGGRKASFAAPSIDGQQSCLVAAQRDAGIAPDAVSYVEAHGTGTPIGDPIETLALKRAFCRDGRQRPLAIGSVKGNFGHTVAAAGVAGLIKTALALENRELPPSINAEPLNPACGFDASFTVQTALAPWRGDGPLFAGVSSFGVGGTNAHVILAEAPSAKARGAAPRHVLVKLAARSPKAWSEAAAALGAAVPAGATGWTIADAAWTALVGRRDFAERGYAVVDTQAPWSPAVLAGVTPARAAKGQTGMVWMFPGQGAQYAGMARSLYDQEPVFRQWFDAVTALVKAKSGIDLVALVLEAQPTPESAAELRSTRITQPAIFAVSYALARLWLALGLRPAALLGHSLGEFVAAVIAGVMSLEDALELVVARGQLLETMPSGGMLAVRAGAAEVQALLEPQCSIAAINGPSLVVVAGPTPAVERTAERLAAAGIGARLLETSHAFHSSMMAPAVQPMTELARRLTLREPEIPIYSSVTGKPLGKEALDPAYWGRHVVAPVDFQAAVVAARREHAAFLEVGPRGSLSQMARQIAKDATIVTSLSPAGSPELDAAAFLDALGRLWQRGEHIEWSALGIAAEGRRRSLPGYPFQRSSYWSLPSDVRAPAASASAPSTAMNPEQQNGKEKAEMIRLEAELKELFEELSGVDAGEFPPETTFFEMGMDSLALTQIAVALTKRYGVKVGFRDLLERHVSIAQLAAHLAPSAAAKLASTAAQPSPSTPWQPASSTAVPAPSTAASAPSAAAPAASVAAPAPFIAAQPPVSPAEAPASPIAAQPAAALSGAATPSMVEMLAQQLKMVQEQLALMTGAGSVQQPSPATTHAPAAVASAPAQTSACPVSTASAAPAAAGLATQSAAPVAQTPAQVAQSTALTAQIASPAAQTAAPAAQTAAPAAAKEEAPKPFGAIARITRQAGGMTPSQRALYDRLVARYTEKTKGSKLHTQENRPVHADPRVVTGFRPEIKEVVYPLVMKRSKGAYLWDVDGNRYVDLTCGFGSNFFGNMPDWLRERLVKQIDEGIEIGPQHHLAGTVAAKLTRYLGHDRVAFCNTGSEAVLGALRIARTITGRSKVISFTGSYHGIVDEVIVRAAKSGKSYPAAPGIMGSSVANIEVLDYGTEASLERIRAQAGDVAAILVESVQSRRPDFRPREFLHALRRIADESGAVLVFDEIITGFRTGRYGAQGYYGVKADLATYGKVIGAGAAIGVIAGKKELMDALDGGFWRFGDASTPEVGVTYFAGTFVRHPLALAAMDAVMDFLASQPDDVALQLMARADGYVARMNAMFAELRAPFQYVNHGSMMKLNPTSELPNLDILVYLLRDKGIHTWDGFPNFLTLAHTDEDIAFIERSFREALLEMAEAGFYDGVIPAAAPAIAKSPCMAPAATRAMTSPSTASQREIWAACQMSREASLAYNESVTLTIEGSIDAGAMLKALEALRARHEALRTTFAEDGASFTVAPKVLAHDRVIPEGDDPEFLRRLKAEVVRDAFDLAKGPLFRAVVVPGLARSHVVMTAHHIVCDGWSTAILIRDLAELYSAQVESRPAVLPERQLFTDFAAKQQSYASTPQAQADLGYWLDGFKASLPAMDLPHDRARPRVRSFASRRVDVDLSPAALAALKKIAAKEGASLFMGLLAAYKVLLWKMLDDEVVVAIPAAAQAEEGWYDLVGHCVNTLPLRSSPEAEQSFRALLREVKAKVLDGNEHQAATFGRILEGLAVERDPSRIPLAPVLFNVDKRLDMSAIRFAGAGATYDTNPRAFEAFEMFHNITEANGTARLECQYNTDLFSDEWIESHLAAYATLLDAITADPDGRLSSLPWAPRSQLERSTGEASGRKLALPAASFLSLFDATAMSRPDAVAVVAKDRALTYAELLTRSNQWARLLASEGVSRGARVGVAVERHAELLPVLLGILKTGAAYIPLDPTYPKDRLSYMAEHSGLGLIVSDSAVASTLPVPSGCRVLLADRVGARLASLAAETPASQAFVGGRDIAYVIYTSGSTGKPKGVEVPHEGIVNFLVSMRQAPGMAAGDRLLAVTTLSFDIAVLELYLPLVAGATVVLATRDEAIDAYALQRKIQDEAITVMQATPSTWRMLVDLDWKGAPLTALCGGEALPAELAGKLIPRVRSLWNMYGPTETTVWSTCRRIEDASQIDIGLPIHNTTLHVLDRFMLPVPWGVPGELFIGGRGVTAGYLGRPDLTDERFVTLPGTPGGGKVYKTGDLVRMGSDGRVHYIRRNDNQVKVRGFRIELGEIEAVLARKSGVRSCVVLVREDRPGDQRLVAYCEGRLDPRELTAWARAELPAYMVPQHIVALDRLPLLPNGKIDRKSLPAPAVASAPAMATAPRSGPVDTQIAALWSEILGIQEVPGDVSFYALGGHSLLAIRMLQALQKRLGKTVTLATFLEHNTLRGLSEALAGGSQAVSAPAIPKVTDGRTGRASVMQERMYFLERFGAGDSANVLSEGRLIKGQLDVAAFLGAVRTLVRRHPMMRARFLEAQSQGIRIVIDETPRWDDQVVDLTALAGAAQDAELRRLAHRISTTPMDLAKDTLFRFALVKLAADSYAVLAAYHHIVWDGWCFDIFWAELHTLYHAALRGEAAALSPLSVDYLDFAAWHRDAVQSPEAQRQLSFWKRYLAGLEIVKVPVDRPSEAEQRGVNTRQEAKWSPELVARLEAIGRAEGTTAFVVMLALYKYLLARRSGQADVQVGTPVQGREHPEVGNVIGDFVSLLVVRSKLDDGISFRDWVRTVKASLEGALAHQLVPIEDIMRAIGARGVQLCQSHFSYQDTSERRTEWQGLDVKQISLPKASAGADLSFWMRKSPRGIDLGFDFRADLFRPATIASLLEEFDHLARLVANDPDLPLVMRAEAPVVASAPLAARAAAASRSVSEERLMAICSKVLGVDAIAPTDNFFDLGGHSLLLLQVISQIEAETGKRVPITLFLTETLAAIAPRCGFEVAVAAPAPEADVTPAAVPKPVKGGRWRELLKVAFGDRRDAATRSGLQ